MIKINIQKQLHGSNGLMNLNVNLEIKQGEFVALAGLSGSGKTTLLRILAGLEEASGIIKINNSIWLDEKFSLSPQKREIGFVFQDYALFPNYTVLENLLYVNKDIELANHLLKITELSELKKRLPQTLSGGQKQRISLCRALMNRPKILLMDEPLSALDPSMRTKLQNEILTLHKEFNTTTIMVSHDPSEIYRLSNRMVVLNNGQIMVKYGLLIKILLVIVQYTQKMFVYLFQQLLIAFLLRVRINLKLAGLVLERLKEYLFLINMKRGWEHIVLTSEHLTL